MKKRFCAAALSAMCLLFLSFPVAAASTGGPYFSYQYNSWDESVAAPQIYLPERTFVGNTTEAGSFAAPQDFYVASDNRIYIADTGNKRIVVLDEDFGYVREFDGFIGENGGFGEPTGVFVTDDRIYVADRSGKVLAADLEGNLQWVLESPRHPLIADDFLFSPIKVATDSAGRIYVLSYGCYYGLLQFTPDLEFVGYYGSNPVEVTPAAYLNYIWKQILSQEQRESMTRLLPVEYSNLDVGPDGFLYTSTIATENKENQLKKLNPFGNNVLKDRDGGAITFGDYEFSYNLNVMVNTAYCDIHVDDDLFFYGLDMARKRVFLYDNDGQLVGVFGGQGYQKGTFQQPVAIDSMGDRMLVLDATKNNITVFEPTDYMQNIRTANTLYWEGRYEEAQEPWEQVIARNNNSLLGHVGVGKALSKQGTYQEAMAHFEAGGNRYDYSKTFQEYRLGKMRVILPTAVVVLLSAVVLGYILSLCKKRWRRVRRK